MFCASNIKMRLVQKYLNIPRIYINDFNEKFVHLEKYLNYGSDKVSTAQFHYFSFFFYPIHKLAFMGILIQLYLERDNSSAFTNFSLLPKQEAKKFLQEFCAAIRSSPWWLLQLLKWIPLNIWNSMSTFFFFNLKAVMKEKKVAEKNESRFVRFLFRFRWKIDETFNKLHLIHKWGKGGKRLTYENGKTSEHKCARLCNKFWSPRKCWDRIFTSRWRRLFMNLLNVKMFAKYFHSSCHRVALTSFLLPLT